MKFIAAICILLFLALGGVGLAQLWYAPLEWEVFVKVMITLGALLLMAMGATVAVHEFFAEKKLRDDNYLDG